MCPARWLHGQRVSVVRRSRASPMRALFGFGKVSPKPKAPLVPPCPPISM